MAFGADSRRKVARRRRSRWRPNSSVGLATASDLDDRALLQRRRLPRADRTCGRPTPARRAARADIKDLPARFDASGDAVEQYEATSHGRDQDPLFRRAPEGDEAGRVEPDPALRLRRLPGLACCRPTRARSASCGWSAAGSMCWPTSAAAASSGRPGTRRALKTKRQLIFDDFAAVAKDLIARKITSPRRLGIQGGSNGGPADGRRVQPAPGAVARRGHPGAAARTCCASSKIGAGASWVGEYGSVTSPDERAFLEKISPYQNLKAGVAYPEPLLRHLHQGRPGDARPRPQDGRQDAGARACRSSITRTPNGGHAASANLQERAERVALEFTYLTPQADGLMDAARRPFRLRRDHARRPGAGDRGRAAVGRTGVLRNAGRLRLHRLVGLPGRPARRRSPSARRRSSPARGNGAEWKVYSHDHPADLEDALAAAGWADDGPETFLAIDLADAALADAPPPGVEVRQVRDRQGCADLVAVSDAAFGRAEPWRLEALVRRLGDPTQALFVAYADGLPVSSGPPGAGRRATLRRPLWRRHRARLAGPRRLPRAGGRPRRRSPPPGRHPTSPSTPARPAARSWNGWVSSRWRRSGGGRSRRAPYPSPDHVRARGRPRSTLRG